jgi:hypothetical protein
MVKNSMILSVSVSKQEAEFLDIQGLSPSELLQEKILEQKRIFDIVEVEKNKIYSNFKRLEKLVQDMNEFLELSGKADDFLKWRNTNVVLEK